MVTTLFLKIRKRVRVFRARSSARTQTKRLLKTNDIKRLLVLCYGNIYRSPLVASYLNDNLGAGFEIRSAGFHHKQGRQSPQAHVEMCAENNIDLSKHLSAMITTEMVEWADAIVIMDKHNWYALAELNHSAISKVIWLGAVSIDTPIEILDPYGHTPEYAKKIVVQLVTASEKLVESLEEE